MPIFYMFSNEEKNNIINGKGMAGHACIYADNKIEEPKYDYNTNKFVVRYHTTKKGKIEWAQSEFDTRSSALEFYTKKYHEFMYEWTLLFYDDFKQKANNNVK